MTIRKNIKSAGAKDWRPSLRQIAEECGLTVATVSRILNGKKNFKCNPKTAKLVLAVARKHKYLPNRLLNNMRGGRTRSIGVILAMRMSMQAEIIHGIHHELVDNNYVMIQEWNDATIHSDGGERERVMIHRLIEHRVDGIILFPTNENATELYFKEVLEREIPLVVLDIPLRGVDTDFVGTDNFDCGRQAASFLISQGHRQLFSLLPAGEFAGHPFVERIRGFEDAVRNISDVEYMRIEYVQKVEGIRDRKVFTSNNMSEAVLPVLKSSKPCAVFCGSDNIAKEFYQIVKNSGRKIPDDISVIGVGNLDFTELLDPPLTSIDQHPFEIGAQAAAMILKRLENGSGTSATPLHLSMKGTLIARNSVKVISEN